MVYQFFPDMHAINALKEVSSSSTSDLGKYTEYFGCFWRKADPEEYETFDEDVHQINLDLAN